MCADILLVRLCLVMAYICLLITNLTGVPPIDNWGVSDTPVLSIGGVVWTSVTLILQVRVACGLPSNSSPAASKAIMPVVPPMMQNACVEVEAPSWLIVPSHCLLLSRLLAMLCMPLRAAAM